MIKVTSPSDIPTCATIPTGSCSIASGGPNNDYGQVDALSLILELPDPIDYEFFMPFGGAIYELVVKTLSGSGVCTVSIDSTVVTGMNAVVMDTTRRTYLSTGNVKFIAGQLVHFTINSGTVQNLEATIAYRRDSSSPVKDLIDQIGNGTVTIGVNSLTASGTITATNFSGSGAGLSGLTNGTVTSFGTGTTGLTVSSPNTTPILGGSLNWSSLNKTGSSLADLATRSYASLQGIPSSFPPSSHTHDASDVTTGILGAARLGSGSASSSTFLRGDGTWATVGTWGSITGTLSSQTDLQSALNLKQDASSALTGVTLSGSGVLHGTATYSTIAGVEAISWPLVTQTANTVLAGPATGTAATPTMRALVVADIPALSYASTAQGALASSAVQPSTAPTLTGTNFTGIPQSGVTGLTTSLSGKQATITLGSTAQYLKGDLSLGTFPTALSSFTNDSAFITSAGAPVQSVAGRTGAVTLSQTDVSGTATSAQGALAASAVQPTTANTYTAGAKQTFAASATTAGERFLGVAADPSVLTEGDKWYRTDTHRQRLYDGTAAQSLATLADLTAYAPLVSPSFTTPNIGAATGASLSLSGGTITTATTNGNITLTPNGTGSVAFSSGLSAPSSFQISTSGTGNAKLLSTTAFASGDYGFQISNSGAGNALVEGVSKPLALTTFGSNDIIFAPNRVERARISAATGTATHTVTAIGTTATDGLVLTNTTAAASGLQQYSPSFTQTGAGYGTTGAASQAVSFRQTVKPAQGTTATGTWTLESSVGGAAFGNVLSITNNGTITTIGDINMGAGKGITTDTQLLFQSAKEFRVRSNTARMSSTFAIGWTNAADTFALSSDVAVSRGTTGVVEFLNDTAQNGNGGTWRSKPTTPAQITADQNNYNPGGSSYYQRLSTDAARTITGLTFTAAQVDGQTHVGANVGTNSAILANQNTGSLTANRFLTNTGANITLGANDLFYSFYDGTTGAWRAAKFPSAFSDFPSGPITAGTVASTGVTIGTPTAAAITQSGGGAFIVSQANKLGIYSENTTAQSTSQGSILNLTQNDGTAMLSGNRLGSIAFNGNNGAGATGTGVTISGYAENNWSSTDRGSYLAFETVSAGGTSKTEKMRLTSAGGVNIGGTSDPGAGRLTVGNAANGSGAYSVDVNVDSSGNGGARFVGGYTLGPSSGVHITARTSADPTAADQRLGVYGFGSDAATTVATTASMGGFSSEAWSTGTKGSYLRFDTTVTGATTRAERMRIGAGVNIGGQTDPGAGRFAIATSVTPASATATGTTGTIAWDASYIYVCTATNTWKRVTIATW